MRLKSRVYGIIPLNEVSWACYKSSENYCTTVLLMCIIFLVRVVKV